MAKTHKPIHKVFQAMITSGSPLIWSPRQRTATTIRIMPSGSEGSGCTGSAFSRMLAVVNASTRVLKAASVLTVVAVLGFTIKVTPVEAAAKRCVPGHVAACGQSAQTPLTVAVEVFDLHDHPKASRIYAWTHETDDSETPRRTVTVLHIPPVTSPRKAVQVSIVQAFREAEANAEG